MAVSVRPTYQAIVDQAMSVTAAETAWLLAVVGEDLEVIATAGLANARGMLGTTINPTGAQGYALYSGQPVALMPQPADPANQGAAGHPGVPTSLLAAPCGDESVLGILEVGSKRSSSPFTFDDIDTVSLLAAVAGAAIAEDDGSHRDVASPKELAGELQQLADADPGRYADAARLIASLLGQGA